MIRLLIVSLIAFCQVVSAGTTINGALLKKSEQSVNKAVEYLLSKQNKDGSWGAHGGFPEVTALVTTALATSFKADTSEVKNAVAKSEKYLLQFVEQDGSIWRKGERGYPNYSTSVAVVAFYMLDKKKHAGIIKKARNWLKQSQFDGTSGNSAIDEGGFGYGVGKKTADLSNTQMALEALYITNDVEEEGTSPKDIAATKECWKRAQTFLSRCQASPTSNDQAWAKNVKGDDLGGFIYSPDRVKEEKDGKKTDHNVYGSMTYAGLKTMVYAGYMQDDKLNKNDPRIKAAVEWAVKHYSLDENPGMGTSGLYYYIQTFTKAMHAYGEPTLKGHNWRKDVVEKLISLQDKNGSWVNQNGRWMENMPEMVTAFSLTGMNYVLNE